MRLWRAVQRLLGYSPGWEMIERNMCPSHLEELTMKPDCLPQVEQLKAAGVPEAEQLKFQETLAANPQLSFMDLLSLWQKYKDRIPLFWEFVTDVWAIFRSTQAAPTPATPPEAPPSSPFGP